MFFLLQVGISTPFVGLIGIVMVILLAVLGVAQEDGQKWKLFSVLTSFASCKHESNIELNFVSLIINQIGKHVVSKVSFGSARSVIFTGKRENAGHEKTTVNKLVITV